MSKGMAWLAARIEHYYYDAVPKDELRAWIREADRIDATEEKTVVGA